FDLDDNGSVEQSGTSATYTFPAGDGPSSRTVKVTVTDPDGSASDTTAVTVNNVAPNVSSATVNPTVGTAGVTSFSYSVTASDPVDPITYRWDFDGNGSTDHTGANPPARTFGVPGTYNGTVTADDGDGGVTVRNLPAVTVNPTGGGGGPTDDDDGDGVINLLDAQPQNPALSRLTRLCGSGGFVGATSGTGRLTGCLAESNVFGIKFLTGALGFADAGVNVQTLWFLSGRAVRTASNAAYYSGTAIGGFSFQYGLIMYSYQIAVVDNGASGDTIAVRVTGGGKNYLHSATLSSGGRPCRPPYGGLGGSCPSQRVRDQHVHTDSKGQRTPNFKRPVVRRRKWHVRHHAPRAPAGSCRRARFRGIADPAVLTRFASALRCPTRLECRCRCRR
ncbi:MAG: hypothetical protein DYH08_11805, partial [Actinobacteria bacterium ATB1]|nr:hypothetical protein [Actinobacteria bacterium ATB1]